MCGKKFEADPVVARDGDLCPECRKTYKDMAVVYCMKCKKVVTRAAPGLAGKLLVKPGDILHVRECPKCTPGIVRSVPVEMEDEKGG